MIYHPSMYFFSRSRVDAFVREVHYLSYLLHAWAGEMDSRIWAHGYGGDV